ncbi:MAG TPA: glucose-6-phosphate isomerase [Planctomicrobium sp.]|nr:glucose-6-phosphate isomerase [Planctomicrobium sp.]
MSAKSVLTYNPAACEFLVQSARPALSAALEAAREETLADVELLHSGGAIPSEKQPLDSGFIDLPKRLLAGEDGLLERMEKSASELQQQIDRLIVLGIGGSYMGLRALFEALCDPYHNELCRGCRKGKPKLYYEGNNLDNDGIVSLLSLLKRQCKDPKDVEQRWGINVISKSGGTLETAAAFRIFREALDAYYGADSEEARELVIPITGETGKLRNYSNAKGYKTTFPIPDGVGGRFSVFTAVGLYPAAALGIDIRALLQGAADMTESFANDPIGSNPVLDYVATCHLLERDHGMDLRVLSTWGKKLEAVGLWYDQLLAESLGKEEKGATPLTVVNTRDLHSRGQQHQEGKRDRVITNVIVDAPNKTDVLLPKNDDAFDQDQLNRIAGKTTSELLAAAIQGTNKAYADVQRPTADIHLPKLDAYALGQLLQFFMLATVVEGRLIGINPYGQPGVEDYKNNMGAILYGK